MSLVSLTITCQDKPFSLPSAWASRWSFLSEILSDELMVKSNVEWTYTAPDEFASWMRLNEKMDEYSLTKTPISALLHPGRRVPTSSVWNVVDFMRPTNTDWSIYTALDTGIPEENRKVLYERLGRFIRESGQRFPYSRAPTGTLGDFYLFCDPVYPHHARHYYFSRLSREQQKTVMELEDLNVLTGILHSSYSLNEKDNRWSDIATMVSHPYLLDPLSHDVDETPIAYLTTPQRKLYIESLKNPTARNVLAHFMADLPLPVEKGPLPLYIEKEYASPSFFSHLHHFCHIVPDYYLPHFVDRCGLEDYMKDFNVQGDALSLLFSVLPRTDFKDAAHFISEEYGEVGIEAYRVLLARYRSLIHIDDGGDPLMKIENFLSALCE